MRFRQWAGGVLVTSPRLQRGGYLVPRLGFFRFSTISWFRVGGGEDGAAAADAETSGVLLSSCRLYCVNCQFSTSRYRRGGRGGPFLFGPPAPWGVFPPQNPFALF